MQLGRFTELQKYNVPISTVQLTKRQAKQASFGHSSARIPNFVSLLATVPGAHRFNNTQSQSVVRRVDGNYTASDCQQKADHNSATDVPPPLQISCWVFLEGTLKTWERKFCFRLSYLPNGHHFRV